MKKVFKLTDPKIKSGRVVDSVRCDVKRYIKRERKKELPEGVDFWDFACKCGATADDAKVVHMAEISKCIDEAEAQELESIYIEIMAKKGRRTKKPKE